MPVDVDQNRLVAKDVELGTIRSYEENPTYIGTTLAPWESVESDDVIFSYVVPDVSGLAPARAEDAESELYERDDTFGQGRASIIDWSLKDRYSASDVSRYREYLAAVNSSPGAFPLTISRMTEDFETKLARDSAQRRSRLDNRAEWLAVKGAFENQIVYNDGKITFTVTYGRPGGQTAQAPSTGNLWSATNSDPIADIEAVRETMYNTYGFRPDHGYTSEKVLRSIINSDRFAARSGISIPSGASGGSAASGPVDPAYLIDGWGWQAAVNVVQAYTGVTLVPYDAVYRTRALGSTTTTVNRFSDERDVLFLPPSDVINDISDLGFGKMLTSPHAEGNWTSGFYEWEEETRDPWTHVRGTGIKMFPVYPHNEYSYTMRVLA